MNADLEFISTSRENLRQHWLADETGNLNQLIPLATLSPEQTSQISRQAQKLIYMSREHFKNEQGLDAFLNEYDLSSQEGVVLMCLAEALLRIPDSATADQLIQDKLSNADWSTHIGHSQSLFVNASTWGLLLTGRMVSLNQESYDIKSLLNRLISRSGEPFIRIVLKEAMHIMAKQFIIGRTIEEALANIKANTWGTHKNQEILYSFDMLGESAITQADAEQYFKTYQHAIQVLAQTCKTEDEVFTAPINRPGLSIKLSALHPRFNMSQRERVIAELSPRLHALCTQAMDANIGITLDAEESDKLELMLDLFEGLFKHPAFRSWAGIGLAVQTYQKRALPLIHWLIALAKEQGKLIMLRLVKGAYWDSEIKQAQEQGLESYPVYTRKVATDISYIACVNAIRENPKYIYPQFATHNAYTIAAVIEMMRGKGLFEFQALYGMGKAVYSALQDSNKNDFPIRIYAPVGRHHDLLPYLVRRLLENGANTSFLNRFAHQDADMETLLTPPVEAIYNFPQFSHGNIPLPANLYQPERSNSPGLNLANPEILLDLQQHVQLSQKTKYKASCLLNGKNRGSGKYEIINPAINTEHVGFCNEAESDLINDAITQSGQGFEQWRQISAQERAACLDRIGAAVQKDYLVFLPLLVREAGRCIPDALSEIRETIDYCHYYAMLIRQQFSVNQTLPGPTGESNELSLHGRGVFACISPWNFPLAIFAGQILAALAAGNAVIAKPARQTPLVAYHFVKLLHDCGIPKQALQLMLGSGAATGMALIDNPGINGVAFTGSTETAVLIQKHLIQRGGPLVPLIAETGGLNAMIVDSSALPEQVVKDVLVSAFNSAGQRCSALRILYVQDSLLPQITSLLSGAMDELQLGDPAKITTDVGPLISSAAVKQMQAHINHMKNCATLIKQVQVPADLPGYYTAPHVFQLESQKILEQEVFGPILHIIPFKHNKLTQVIEAINTSGYGLTLGIHSRIEKNINKILNQAKIGNIYVNRNMIGAVVGVQPFGGEGLSGTGPKAGGPDYLRRFATERTLSINTTAIGGNTSLLSLNDD